MSEVCHVLNGYTPGGSSASATSIDGSGPPRLRAAWRSAATNHSSESMVSMSRMRGA
jgi:hypothetical protein